MVFMDRGCACFLGQKDYAAHWGKKRRLRSIVGHILTDYEGQEHKFRLTYVLIPSFSPLLK